MTDIRQQLATMLSNHKYAISLIEPTDLDTDERASIPGWWFEALTQPRPAAALERALDEWEATVPGRLPEFLAYAREHGQGLFLGRQAKGTGPDTQTVLVYVLADATGSTPFYCWTGTPPLPAADIPPALQELPIHLKSFHSHLHDTFTWAQRTYGGILPIAELEPISNYAAQGELELVDTEPDGDPDYTRTIAIYSDSTPRICVELSDNPNAVAGWFWDGAEISRIDDIWQSLDGWLTLSSKG